MNGYKSSIWNILKKQYHAESYEVYDKLRNSLKLYIPMGYEFDIPSF